MKPRLAYLCGNNRRRSAPSLPRTYSSKLRGQALEAPSLPPNNARSCAAMSNPRCARAVCKSSCQGSAFGLKSSCQGSAFGVKTLCYLAYHSIVWCILDVGKCRRLGWQETQNALDFEHYYDWQLLLGKVPSQSPMLIQNMILQFSITFLKCPPPPLRRTEALGMPHL